MVAIPGYEVNGFRFVEDEATVYIYLTRVSKEFTCPCGKVKDTYWDKDEFTVRDLSYGKWKYAYLVFDKYRVRCDDCEVQTEKLEWLDLWARHTKRLEEAVALACKEVRSITAIADAFDMDWRAVKEIDKQALKERLDPPDFSDVERIAVDEIAIQKGHKYATMIIDFDRHRVLWVSKGRKKESLDAFYKKLGEEGCKKIKAAAMDMWEPYMLSTKEYTDADIVYDPFHIINNFGKVMNEVRNLEAKKAKDESKKATM